MTSSTPTSTTVDLVDSTMDLSAYSNSNHDSISIDPSISDLSWSRMQDSIEKSILLNESFLAHESSIEVDPNELELSFRSDDQSNTSEQIFNQQQQNTKLSINYFTKGGPQSISPQRAALMIDFLKQKLGPERLAKIEEEIIKPAGEKFSVKDHGDQITKLISSEHLQFIQFFSVYEGKGSASGGV